MARGKVGQLTLPGMATQQVVRSSKRKRVEISYAETNSGDEYLSDADLGDDLSLVDEDENDESDEDDEDEEFVVDKKKTRKDGRKKQKTLKSGAPKKVVKESFFPFLELAGELRNQIYEYALVDPLGLTIGAVTKHHRRKPIRIQSGVLRPSELFYADLYWRRPKVNPSLRRDLARLRDDLSPLSPALIAVNRQLNAEAGSMFYGQQLHIYDTTVLHGFVTNLGPAARRHLRSLILYNWGRGSEKAMNFAGLTTLVDCTNLQSVIINCRMTFKTGAPLARQIMKDGFQWLDTLVIAKGDIDSAVEILQLDDRNYGRASEFSIEQMDEQQVEAHERAVQHNRDEYFEELTWLLYRPQ